MRIGRVAPWPELATLVPVHRGVPCVPREVTCVRRVVPCVHSLVPCVPRVALCVPRVALWAWMCHLVLAPRLLSYFCEQVPTTSPVLDTPGPVWLKSFLNSNHLLIH